MEMLTARPENMFGNVALASVVAGIPVGLLFAVIGLATHPIAALDTWKASLGSVLLAPVFILVAGLIMLPVLYGLRRLGYAGPLVVWALSGLFSIVLMSSDVRAGLLGLMLAMPASYVFCRYAYN